MQIPTYTKYRKRTTLPGDAQCTQGNGTRLQCPSPKPQVVQDRVDTAHSSVAYLRRMDANRCTVLRVLIEGCYLTAWEAVCCVPHGRQHPGTKPLKMRKYAEVSDDLC